MMLQDTAEIGGIYLLRVRALHC